MFDQGGSVFLNHPLPNLTAEKVGNEKKLSTLLDYPPIYFVGCDSVTHPFKEIDNRRCVTAQTYVPNVPHLAFPRKCRSDKAKRVRQNIFIRGWLDTLRFVQPT